MTPSRIRRLLFSCGPAAVVGLVIAVVVWVAVDSRPGRAWPHVSKEVFEHSPTRADSDATAAVVLEVRMCCVLATSTHGRPTDVLGTWLSTLAVAMRSESNSAGLISVAAATGCPSGYDMGQASLNDGPAVAGKGPKRAAIFHADAMQGSEAAEALAADFPTRQRPGVSIAGSHSGDALRLNLLVRPGFGVWHGPKLPQIVGLSGPGMWPSA